jgi:hypothetical protein
MNACDSLLPQLVEEVENVGEERHQIARLQRLGSGTKESVAMLTFPRKSGQVGYMLEVASEFLFS